MRCLIFKLNGRDIVARTARRGISVPNDQQLYMAQNASCFYCGLYMTPQKLGNIYKKTKCDRTSGFTYDHLFPKSLGFGLAGNKVLACTYCNHVKSSNLPTIDQVERMHKMYKKLGKYSVVQLNSC